MAAAESDTTSRRISRFLPLVYIGMAAIVVIGIVMAITGIGVLKPDEKEVDKKLYMYSREYHEQHPEKYPILMLEVTHPEAIEVDHADILITTKDNLLIDFIYAYADGYIEADETYLYPATSYYIQFVMGDKYCITEFTVKSDVVDNAVIYSSFDCETGETRLSTPDDVLDGEVKTTGLLVDHEWKEGEA